MLKRFIALAMVVLATILTLASTVHAQKSSEDVFEAVPMALRGRLVERLNEYLAFERTQQYEKLYELLYDRDDKNGDKKAYSTSRLKAESRSGVVQEFRPTFIMNITLSDGDAPTFTLKGSAKVLLKGRPVKKEMSINARLQDGEWYFSELVNSFLHID